MNADKINAAKSGPFSQYFDSIVAAHAANGYPESAANDIAGYAILAASLALETVAREANTGELLTSISASTIACQLLRDFLTDSCEAMEKNAPELLARAAKETAQYARDTGEPEHAAAYEKLAEAAEAGGVAVVKATIKSGGEDPGAKTVH